MNRLTRCDVLVIIWSRSHNQIEAQKKLAVDRSILSEVRCATSLTKQIALAIIAAVLTPLILGGRVAVAYSFDRFMPSATAGSHSITAAP